MMSNSSSLEHLNPDVRPLVEEPTWERTQFIKRERWIGYTRAMSVMGSLQDLLDRPPATRMPFAMVLGPSNNGKSALVDRFRKRAPRVMNEPEDSASMPVVGIVQLGTADLRTFFSAILSAYEANYNSKDPATYLRQQVHAHIRTCNTRVLVIDDLHNILRANVATRSTYLNELRGMSQVCRIAIVCAGTSDAALTVSIDPQLENRFRWYPLPRWTRNQDFARFLATLERVLPLREPSGLADTEIQDWLLQFSEGLLGEVVSLVAEAAERALNQGRERVSLSDFKALGVVPPSRRREDVDRQLPF